MIIFIKMNFFLLEVTYMQKKKSNISEGGYKQFMTYPAIFKSLLVGTCLLSLQNSISLILKTL